MNGNEDAGEKGSAANSQPTQTTAPDYHQYAGSQACLSCHQDIAEHFNHTAHHLTSAIATGNNVMGSFSAGTNTYSYDSVTVVKMEKRKDSFYQVLYQNGKEQKAASFDIVFGSGVMGQSYLYWLQNNLYQLPITYFTAAKEWSNSPSFPPQQVLFYRDITARCMECHSTFAKVIPSPIADEEAFDRQQIIYGVECEKCHGPGAKHVAFQQQHPSETNARYIVNPAKFSRQQSLELCALCHGGKMQKTKPSFSFVAGDTLASFFTMDTTVPEPRNVDVHGNQYGRLRASKCFKMSDTMTCNTCHNTHNNERDQLALYSSRCMTCHNTAHNNFCKMADKLSPAITTNCIDCHMPLNPSRAIAVFLPGGGTPTAAMIRTHYISIYPEETKKVMSYIKQAASAEKQH